MESHEKDLRSVVENENQQLAVQNDYHSAGLTTREVALLDFAVKLTKQPSAMNRHDLEFLRKFEFTDEQLVDLVHTISYFNFINRVLDGLGVGPEANMRYENPD